MHFRLFSFVLGVSILSSVSCSGPEKPVSSEKLNQLDLQGHRGARGLRPENTWPAFESAIEHGMNTLEFDTVVTADKDLIIFHDTHLNPELCLLPDGSPAPHEPISDWGVKDLKTLDCGTLKNERFPEQKPSPGEKLMTLDDLFVRIRTLEKSRPELKNLKFNIETKFPGHKADSREQLEEFAHLMVSEIQKHSMSSRSTVQSFVPEVLPLVEKLDDSIERSALYQPTRYRGALMKIGLGDSYRDEILQNAEKNRATIISPYFLYVNDYLVKKAHRLNMKVIPWTVNKRENMKSLIHHGVDGIITDYPDRLAEVTGRR